MTIAAGSIQSFAEGQIGQNDAPPPSFRPKRSGVEKSHAEMWHATWWQEVSRLCVSLEPKVFAIHTGAFLRSR